MKDRGLELLLKYGINPEDYTHIGVLNRIIEKNIPNKDMLEIIYSFDWKHLVRKPGELLKR